jgi:hypothetical protein
MFLLKFCPLEKRRLTLKKDNFKQGRWELEEHERFLIACYNHGQNWQKVRNHY